jgi:hypothetical protein
MIAVDFFQLLRDALPPAKRKAKVLAFLRGLMIPIRQLYSSPSILSEVQPPSCVDVAVSFQAWRAYILNRAGLTGQTLALEKLLNIWFFNAFNSSATPGAAGYQIYITDNTPPLVDFVMYQRSEQASVRINLKTEGTTGMPPMYRREDVLIPFSTINIPTSLSVIATPQVVFAILRQYAAAGVTFTINYY